MFLTNITTGENVQNCNLAQSWHSVSGLYHGNG